MRVPLRGLHLLEAPLVLLDHRSLVRNHDVGVDRNGKVEAHKIAQYPRKSGIGQILQSYERVQKTTDSDVRLFLVLNVCIDDLLPCAAMLERELRPAKGDSVEHQRIQRSLHFEEDLCVCQPPYSHSCRSQRLFDTGEDGPELRQNIIVFPRCSLDASIRRQAEAIEVEALRYRLAEGGARKLVMNCGIPVEVAMQKRPQIVAFLLLFPPGVHPYAIERQERRILIPELLLVPLPQIAEPFGDLEPHLHSHRSFGQ